MTQALAGESRLDRCRRAAFAPIGPVL